ncbi:hypothetical protein [Paludisphaera rhizosphaerae]|uniref:hypothetical protein n=1 Tax=Paludisphaera rhizosphaerae TaxID=2711216 RepID=UPI0013EB544C|nr:hypothetical protein [Paludisphaera rhizosphaerae]
MTSPEPFDPDDPFAVHFHREPMGTVGVGVVVLSNAPIDPEASSIWDESLSWLRSQGRPVDVVFQAVDPTRPQLGVLIREALIALPHPIIALAASATPPSQTHWAPLLKALDQADHVVGGRPAGGGTAVARSLARIVRRLVFGVPVADVYSPLRLHRAEKLWEIPLQSGSSFVNVEVLAKATFLGHILDEPKIPALAGTTWRKGSFHDLNVVFKKPTFRRPPEYQSGPFEESESKPEGPDRPGGEDRQGHEHSGVS